VELRLWQIIAPSTARGRAIEEFMHKPVRKAVFPVAGLGTRFLPATKAMPKEMLPIVDKPLIHYAVEEAKAAGIEEFFFVTSRGKSAIDDHFDRAIELEAMLRDRGKTDLLDELEARLPEPGQMAYTRQQKPLGLGHAVWCARALVGNEPFAVLLADDVIDNPIPALKQMVDVFEQKQCSVIAAQVVEGKMISSYGVFDAKPADGFNGRLFEIKNMVEKPKPEEAPSNLAITGRYILTPAVFNTLSETQVGAGGELQLTDGMRLLLKKEKIFAYVYEGNRYDTGDKLGFLKATVEFALKRSDLGGPFREYLKELKL